MGASRFFFERFSIDIPGGRVRYRYRTDGGHIFDHELMVPFPEGSTEQDLSAAAFTLGMAELAHFWKALLTPEIVIEAGQLDDKQIQFWENLYMKGLGEFFYVNEIDFRGLITITVADDAPVIPVSSASLSERALVPFGGGKDSLVTGELLKARGKDFAWFELEPLPFGEKLREVSGVTECVSIGRDVAQNFAAVMELVKEGAPNGHVPITATYMASAALAALMTGRRDIVMSLERSADEGNVEYLGHMINHQYSKTFEFETMMASYLAKYVHPELRLFSLLRPLYELQIVREFTKHPAYFPHFLSCNRGLKTGSWCGACAKCAFMFAALSAFLPKETVVTIFGNDLLEDEALVPLYEELIGKAGAKPFDCVGTYDENLLALYLAGQKRGLPLPPVLAALPIAEGEKYLALLESRGDAHIPEDYA